MHRLFLNLAVASIGGLVLSSGSASATLITDIAADVEDKTFDYIVVGAGLAGITVSNKVSITAQTPAL